MCTHALFYVHTNTCLFVFICVQSNGYPRNLPSAAFKEGQVPYPNQMDSIIICLCINALPGVRSYSKEFASLNVQNNSPWVGFGFTQMCVVFNSVH